MEEQSRHDVTKKRPVNRLKSMYPLRNLVNEAYLRTIQASASGAPTAWSMVNWWEGDIILKAMNIEVVYPENYGAIAASMGIAGKYLELAESEGFPSYTCGYARTTLGYTYRMMRECDGKIPPEAPLGGMARPSLLVGAGSACDARFKWFQSLGRYFDTPQWVLEMPHLGVAESQQEGARDHALEFIVEELKEFISFLERLFGKKMNWDRLSELVEYTLQINRIFHEINELRKARPCPMHSLDFWSSMPACLFLVGDLEKSLSLYNDMYREVQERIDNGISGITAPERFRLLFAELPPWHSLKFFDTLAERGWNFVVESHAYHPILPIEEEMDSDPLMRIARISYQFFHGRHNASLDDGIYNSLIEPYLDHARQYRCDGAFLHPLLSCRMASVHLRSLKETLMRRFTIPSLQIEGDIVDIRLFNLARALTEAEAFEEMMDYYREKRGDDRQ